MNHIRPPRLLPPLNTVLPDFRELPKTHTQIHALLEALRKLASSLRTRETQPFYSTREAAAFFGVSQPTVVRVYRELEAEGLLARRRSALTMLTPFERRPRATVRGVVGLPIWSYGHSHHSDWRLFFMRLEEHLRRHAFVADFIFFQRDDPRLPDQVERYLDHELDSLIWLYPLPSYTPLMLQLADQGVAVAVVVDRRARFPFPTYGVSWEAAARRALTAWKDQGLRRVYVAGEPPESTPIAPIAQRLGLELITNAEPVDASELLRRLGRARDVGVVLPNSAWCSNAVAGNSAAYLELLGTQRVLHFHHIELDHKALAGVQADFAVLNWDKLAASIADSLASGTFRRQQTPTVFQAEYDARAPAERFAQLF